MRVLEDCELLFLSQRWDHRLPRLQEELVSAHSGEQYSCGLRPSAD